MSSAWAPTAIAGTGILDRRPENPFRGYNLVSAYYCSSDNWSGSATQELHDDDGTYPDYAIALRGSHIVDAMFVALKAGASADEGTESLASIDDASQVLFMGTSAGGGGARFNADHVGETLLATHEDLDYRVIVDAGFHPKDADPPGIEAEVAEAYADFTWEIQSTFRGGRMDASCLAFHQDDPRPCADVTHTLVHHIQTPWYIKMDLSDIANTPGLYADDTAFTQGVYNLTTSMAEHPDFAEENPNYVPAVFAPNCGHHVNLEVSDFYRIALTDGNATVSNADMLHAWATDSLTERILVHATDGPWTSVCD